MAAGRCVCDLLKISYSADVHCNKGPWHPVKCCGFSSIRSINYCFFGLFIVFVGNKKNTKYPFNSDISAEPVGLMAAELPAYQSVNKSQVLFRQSDCLLVSANETV